MTFKLQPPPTFWWKVQLTVPGEIKPETVEMEFNWRSKPDLITFRDEVLVKESDEVSMLGMVKDWKIADAPFGVDTVRALLANYPASAREVAQQYFEAHTESRRKNS